MFRVQGFRIIGVRFGVWGSRGPSIRVLNPGGPLYAPILSLIGWETLLEGPRDLVSSFETSGQGDLVSRVISPIIHIATLVIPIITPPTKSSSLQGS